MGVWTIAAQRQSSNWKELRTIFRALEHEKAHLDRVRGYTVFYFTDNLVSYFVVNGSSSRSPGLHRLVVQIKDLEQELGCHLEVVHVPGTYLIMQGTDGLSRGVWLSPQRQFTGINKAIFQPVPYTSQLHAWALDLLGLPRNQGYHIGSDLQWAPRAIRHQPTFWTPAPELARQALVSFMHAWVQSPRDTSAIFLIPRILQREWGRISRHVHEVGVFRPSLLPPAVSYPSLFPFVFLHVRPFVPALGPPRLDSPSPAKPNNWHRVQAEEVRGLQ